MNILLSASSGITTLVVGAGMLLMVLIPLFLAFAAFFLLPTMPVLLFLKNPEESPAGKPKEVLLVDDDPSSLLALEAAMKSMHYNYKIVSSGAKAIKEMKRKNYDLVVIDYDMPRVTGAQTLMMAEKAAGRGDAKTTLGSSESVPVVAYSSWGRQNWKLPPLRKFQLKKVISKSSPPAVLRKQFSEVFQEKRAEAA